jgi:hypothetical protein
MRGVARSCLLSVAIDSAILDLHLEQRMTFRTTVIRLIFLHVIVFCALFSTACADFTTPDLPPVPRFTSPDNFCASLPRLNGNLYYCGTNVGFLQGGLPNGWAGGCFPALQPNNGLVGYLGYSGSRNAAYGVYSTQGEANDTCALLARAGISCTGIIRCTRE